MLFHHDEEELKSLLLPHFDWEGSISPLSASIHEGNWWLHSASDSRWNCGGRGIVGGGVMPSACTQKVEELKISLGEPPDDLEWEYIKD
jgi:hypothetical protein